MFSSAFLSILRRSLTDISYVLPQSDLAAYLLWHNETKNVHHISITCTPYDITDWHHMCITCIQYGCHRGYHWLKKCVQVSSDPSQKKMKNKKLFWYRIHMKAKKLQHPLFTFQYPASHMHSAWISQTYLMDITCTPHEYLHCTLTILRRKHWVVHPASLLWTLLSKGLLSVP